MKDRSLIKSEKLKKCMMCDNLTEYIDYCAEQRVCSTECMNEFYKLVDEYEEKYLKEIENNN